MRYIFSEYNSNYGTYTFPYAVYAICENKTEYKIAFENGFCPYTGDPSIKEDIFYKARSIRVDLSKFSDSSENRRINNKVLDLNIELEVVPKSEIDPKALQQFCLSYAQERFQNGSLTEERFSFIFSQDYFNTIFTYSIDQHKVAYVFSYLEKGICYYWYSFFDTTYLEKYSLGKWVMWKTIQWCKNNNKDYIYLGTCYQKKSLYKVRDHKGAQYHNGNKWSDNIKDLKLLCDYDSEEWNEDLMKNPEFDII